MDINNNYNDVDKSDEGYIFVSGVGFIKGSKKKAEISNITYVSSMFSFSLMLFICVYFISNYAIEKMYLVYSSNNMGVGTFFLPMAEITSVIMGVVVIIIPYFTYYLLTKNDIGSVIKNKSVDNYSFVNIVVFCLCLFQFCDFITDKINVLLYFFGIDVVDQKIIPPTGIDFLIYILLLMFIAPFFQEVIFRGIILNSIKRVNVGIALFCQSFAFCLLSSDVEGCISLFILGYALGYIYLITNNFILLLVSRAVISFFSIFTDLIYTQISFRLGNIIINVFLLLIFVVGLIAARYILNYINLNFKIFCATGVLNNKEVVKRFCTSPGIIISGGLSLLFIFKYILGPSV